MSNWINEPAGGRESESGPSPTPARPAWMLLVGIAAGLLLAVTYLVWKTEKLEGQVKQVRRSADAEAAVLRQKAGEQQAAAQRAFDEMQARLREQEEQIARQAKALQQQASVVAGRASAQTRKQVEAMVRAMADEQRQRSQRVDSELVAVKEVAATASAKAEGLTTEVGTVRTEVGETRKEVADTRAELRNAVAELRSVRGDLGVQSGLIATNSRELAALRALGERDYYEFDLRKAKAPQRVGPVSMQIRKTDPKRNRYSLLLVLQDRKVEKKDKTLHEPVQFYLEGKSRLHEVVINQIDKDRIVGYLSAPKQPQPATEKNTLQSAR